MGLSALYPQVKSAKEKIVKKEGRKVDYAKNS